MGVNSSLSGGVLQPAMPHYHEDLCSPYVSQGPAYPSHQNSSFGLLMAQA